MILDKLKQMAAQRKTREAQAKAGSDTGARGRLLEVEDPKPLPAPSGKIRKPAPPAAVDADHATRVQDSRRDYVDLDVELVKAATAKAALCVIDGDEYWIPISEMHEPGMLLERRGQSGEITIPMWLAEDKGLA